MNLIVILGLFTSIANIFAEKFGFRVDKSESESCALRVSITKLNLL